LKNGVAYCNAGVVAVNLKIGGLAQDSFGRYFFVLGDVVEHQKVAKNSPE
jgi:hypothetical protein